MPTFKTTQYIFNNPWGAELVDNTHVPLSSLPNRMNWQNQTVPEIRDVNIWEQIYYKIGEIGIYAAWDPYYEFYMIVHNLFINTQKGIELFYGENAPDNVWNRAKELGIILP